MDKQLLDRKACIGLVKDGRSYQEIEATINMLFHQEGLTTINVIIKIISSFYNFLYIDRLNFLKSIQKLVNHEKKRVNIFHYDGRKYQKLNNLAILLIEVKCIYLKKKFLVIVINLLCHI